MDIEDNDSTRFFFPNVMVPETNKENITDIMYYLYNYSGFLSPHILIHQ